MTNPSLTTSEVLNRLCDALEEETTWFDGKVHLTPDNEELIRRGRHLASENTITYTPTGDGGSAPRVGPSTFEI